MPLHALAEDLIRENLERIRAGRKPRIVVIGALTTEQLRALNALRAKQKYEPMLPEIVFIGMHIYQRRVLNDRYSIADVVEQIGNALAPDSIIRDTQPMTTMRNPWFRADKYGNTEIYDEAVFECSARYPRPELFSVIPKGDDIKPPGNRNCAD